MCERVWCGVYVCVCGVCVSVVCVCVCGVCVVCVYECGVCVCVCVYMCVCMHQICPLVMLALESFGLLSSSKAKKL